MNGLSVRKGTAPEVGSFVELKARLQPPPAPLRPGSYDFGRDMYFQGIGASGFVTGSPSGYVRPNSNGHYAGLSGSPESRLTHYFTTSDFSQPAPFTFGNVGRNVGNLRGPGLENLDFAVYKDLGITERFHLQIRGEAFNLTNTPEFANPDTNLQDPTFGAITSQFNSPRQVQVSLRLSF